MSNTSTTVQPLAYVEYSHWLHYEKPIFFIFSPMRSSSTGVLLGENMENTGLHGVTRDCLCVTVSCLSLLEVSKDDKATDEFPKLILATEVRPLSGTRPKVSTGMVTKFESKYILIYRLLRYCVCCTMAMHRDWSQCYIYLRSV